MKKIFKTLFSLLVVLGLVSVAVACDEPTQEPTEEVTPTPTPTPTPQEPTKTYHVVGGYLDDWNTYSDANKMTEITVDALPADIKSQVDTTREITALMKLEGRVFNVGPSWTANANIDGEVVVLNGGYTVKVVRAGYDAEDDNYFADQWNPDPKTSCVANLTPDTLYMPKWVETPAEGEEGLGTWADNPVVIGGAGEYTVYFIEYAGANTAEAPKYAMALVLTKELEEPKTTAELIAEEYEALVAGTVTEATEFEETAKVVDFSSAENADGGYDVKLIASLDEVTFALTFHTDDLTGLEKGKNVKFVGSLDHTAEAVVIGDYTEEKVFANAEVTWAKTGAPTGIYLKGDMNNWGNDAEGKPEQELRYNEAGNPEITIVIEAGKCFKVADATWTNVNLGYHADLDATLVEDGGDGNIKAKLSIALTLTVVDGKLEIKRGRADIYVRGSFDPNWDVLPEYELRCNDEMLPEITVELAANTEFKVATADWKSVVLGSAAVETELTTAFDLTGDNIKVLTAGTYVLTISVDTTGETPAYKLVITAAE